jgi:NAD(P)-dependent dehydrogenase (short-subunit alcohol dehydrogenase family)
VGLLAGKVAVVTGAGRGVGSAVAVELAEAGAAVALAARTVDEIESVAEGIRASGSRAIAVPTDVTRQSEVDTLFAQTREELGEVDVLVNNAAIIGPTGKLWETKLTEWHEVFDINLFSMVRCASSVLPSMVERGYGKIINVGSTAGWTDSWVPGNAEQAAYAATKAAIMRFSVCLAQQVKADGVNVNCVGVSAHTRMSDEARLALARVRGTPPPPTMDDLPIDQQVLPERNAPLFVFLASSLSDNITGQYLEANQMPHRAARHN